METEDAFKKNKAKVEHILETFPEAREGDPLMTILYVWRKYDGLPNWIVQQILDHRAKHGLEPLETTRRNRQKLQNKEGKYKPSEATEDARAERAKTIKGFISKEEDDGTIEQEDKAQETA